MNKKRVISVHISKNSEQEAKENFLKASREWKRREITNCEKSEWQLIPLQQNYKKEDTGIIPLKFLGEIIVIL